MFRKVLVANRGEIAVRIIRACHEMGIGAVAVYSSADKDQLHVKLADLSVCIGPPQASLSYLNSAALIEAALGTDCDAVHPGYGFLSESPEFAAAVEHAGLRFIGPSASVILQMGEKANARERMKDAGVPVVPGSDGTVDTVEEAIEIAEKIGYPVLVKAASGGGGRGIRAAHSATELEKAFPIAKTEARECFADDRVYIEKLIVNPKHIEVQILADAFGHVVHLGERDCSIQRRHQKMIEESPCAILREETRRALGEAAVLAAKSCGYENAGTVEFVMDADQNFYFIEMNTRIQVEHAVTEMVTGIDLIHEMLRIANGLPLQYTQAQIQSRGHAMEVRIGAVNPLKNFRPSTGTVQVVNTPGGMGTRFDSALFSGCVVSPFYDPMIGKIIVHGRTRLDAIRKMRRAIEETILEGIDIDVGIPYAILFDIDFVRGRYDTGFMEEKLDDFILLGREISGFGGSTELQDEK